LTPGAGKGRFAARPYDKPEPVNLGSGFEISMKNLVGLIAKMTG
jgi:GDP-L-fucose synthase